MTLSKFNRTAQLFTTVPAPGAPYEKLSHLYQINGHEKEYDLCGFYINTKGKYGPQAVAWTHGVYVNLPDHMLTAVQDIMKDPDAVRQINEGRAAFKIYEYEANGRKAYSITFVDVELPY